jgi:predicted phosphodiesterase
MADIHARIDRLAAVLNHAQERGVTSYVDLGDTGSDLCHALLHRVGARAVFGNYEVTGWHRLRPENQTRVRALKPVLGGDTFLAAHAAPYFPADLKDVDDVLEYILTYNGSWQNLFPRLNRDEEARLLAYAKLLERDKPVFFHGHTHVQSTWRVGPGGAVSPLRGSSIVLDAGSRYLVGVGSVGQPEHGSAPQYLIYDEDTMTLHPQSLD